MISSFYVGNDPNDLMSLNSWLGTKATTVQIHGGAANWSDWLSSVGWIDKQYAGTSVDKMWSIPLIPYGADLTTASTGAYNDKYLAMAKQLVADASGQDQIYVRLGWEFNGAGWNSSSAVGQADAYVKAYQQFVTACRSISDKFVFEWCPNIGTSDMNPETAYPGDDYVDVIGIDFYYNTQWDSTDAKKAFAWFVNEPYGLQWQQDFAAAHGKQTAIGEWGLNSDSAEFVKLVADWAQSHDMVYANYWDSNAAFQGELSSGQYPEAAKAFLEAFGYQSASSAATATKAQAAGSIVGTAADDTLTGTAGKDVIDGGTGADKMSGQAGDDIYYVDNARDVVTELANGGTDEVRSSITRTLESNVENLTLIGAAGSNGTGNALDNVLTGNDAVNALMGQGGNDILYGNGGNDSLYGGAGDDKLYGGSGDDLLDGGDGVDRLEGGVGNDRLVAGAGDDVLIGGSGADQMEGGDGNDVYYVDNASDIIYEWLNGGKGGTDSIFASVSYTLGANVENLTLQGTAAINGVGNDGINSLAGNDAANVLDGKGGNDTIHGYGGNDTIYGGIGNDILYGDAGQDKLYGGDWNDTLEGGAGDDLLDGGVGADRMIGGEGNDTYYVDAAGDVVVENAGQGVDTVYASIVYNLGADVENLTLVGTANANATGNAMGNVIIGNAGNNTIAGGAGNDTLYGGGGKDTFVFSAGDGRDVIMDFTTGDTLNLNALVKAAGEPKVWMDATSTYIGFGNDVIQLAGVDQSHLAHSGGLYYYT